MSIRSRGARVFGGPAAEVSQGVGALKDLRAMAGTCCFLMVVDSKLVSYSNVGALLEAGVEENRDLIERLAHGTKSI